MSGAPMQPESRESSTLRVAVLGGHAKATFEQIVRALP